MGGHRTAGPVALAAAFGACETGAAADGRSGCGTTTGAGMVTSPSAGVNTAQGLMGVQPAEELGAELSGGGATATMLGAFTGAGACASTGMAARTAKTVRSNPVRTLCFPFFSAANHLVAAPRL